MTLSPGTKLGRYEIRSQLGAGGMGEVYLARDIKLGRDIALKILPTEVAADRNRMARFVQEARASSTLNHPNILTIYEIDQVDSVYFISSELVQGETLRDLLKKKRLTTAEILELALQISSALVAAHGAGIIHRDLKPENIMLRDDGLVKVVDFGLAKLIGRTSGVVDTEAPTDFRTSPGAVVGTPFYMSPEQIRELDLDARTDIFSFGVVMYEMLAGGLPFKGTASSEVMASIINEREVQPISRDSVDIPAELERIVLKALRKNRDERYQSTKEMLVDLKTLKERLHFERELERSTTPGVERATDPARSKETDRGVTRKRYLGALAAAAILVVSSIAAVYLYKTRSANPTIDSIAVLPFVNASGNSELEYLSDGMTDSLINSLSQLPNLAVKARSSVFRYKGVEVDPQKLSADLSVRAVLNGRVVQHGDDLTLYLSLVDGTNGNQIWGDQYNRKLSDVVVLQSEIARDVARKLQARLSGADENRVARNYTANAEAYQLYLKGRYHARRINRPDLMTAISYYQRAIEIDPSYALAYVGLADAYRSPALEFAPTEVLPKAKAAALKAIELDDKLADAHAVLGWVNFWFDWDWNSAEAQLKRALELDPRNGEAHSYYAHLLSNLGRHNEALAEAKLGRELDPVNLRVNAVEGQCLVFAGQVDAGVDRLKKTLEFDPNYTLARSFLAAAYVQKQMFAEAADESRATLKLAPTSSTLNALLGYSLARAGKTAEARAVADEMIKASSERYVSGTAIATVFNGLDDRERVFIWLERAFQDHDSRLVFLKVDPKWNNLRSEPRFQSFVKRVGLEP
jgi:serine/threonine protein kinase/tetratricopeptide (TPR) repeat protein